jgi:hypothetical protein
MGTKVYGCLAAQNPDTVGETLLIDGCDISRLATLIDEHRGENPSFFHTLGVITASKKLFSDKDADTDLQKRAWQRVQVPMIYIEGELADDTDHPNAKAMGEFLRFMETIPVDKRNFNIGLSVDGGIVERRTPDGKPTEDREAGKILARTVALKGACTIKPANPKCFLAITNDLQKSTWTGEPPKLYWEALKKSAATSSITERPDFQLWYKMESLKKSLNNFFTSMTSMQCKSCGEPVTFFKSSEDMPNRCKHCGEAYSLSNIWKAMNKRI